MVALHNSLPEIVCQYIFYKGLFISITKHTINGILCFIASDDPAGLSFSERETLQPESTMFCVPCTLVRRDTCERDRYQREQFVLLVIGGARVRSDLTKVFGTKLVF